MTVGIALIGSGIFAREQHLPAIKATPSLTLKAIFSRTLQSAQALAESTALENVDLYSEDSPPGKTYADLLARPDIQGLILALPIPHQPDYIVRALDAGKHVLAEKPLAPTTAAGRSLLQHPRASALLSTGENYRFIPSVRYAAVRRQSLGAVTHFRVRMHALVEEGANKYLATSWRKTPTYQGGFLLDGGVHFIAAARLLLGADPARVAAFTRQQRPYLPPIDTVDAIWRLPDGGATGTWSVSFGSFGPRGMEFVIVCERGTVQLLRGRVLVTTLPDGEVECKEFEGEGTGVREELRAWAGAIESGVPDPALSPHEAWTDLAVLEAMLRSGEVGGESRDVDVQGEARG